MATGRQAKPVALPGGFISEPGALAGAPDGLEHLIKLMYRPNVRANGDVGLDVSTDAFVVDLSVVDSARFTAATLAADCDYLKSVVTAHEQECQQIIKELQKGTNAGAARAEKLAQKIGATEADAVAAGGGVIWFAVAAALFATGCIGSGTKHKATSPAATTTPQPKGK